MNASIQKYITSLLLFFLLTTASVKAQDIIFRNAINHADPSQFNPFTIGQVTFPNITASGIGRGSGLIALPAADIYQATSWNTPSIDLTAYFEFSIVPDAGYKINYSTQEFRCNLSGAPNLTPFVVRSSVDNYTANIPFTQANFGAPIVVNLSAAIFQQVTNTITFRIYPFGSATASSNISINEFTFKGTVVQSLGIPSEERPSFKFYPNPVTDKLTLSHLFEINTIAVYNLLGQIILFKEINATKATIDFSSFENAVYIVKMTFATGKSETARIIKI